MDFIVALGSKIKVPKETIWKLYYIPSFSGVRNSASSATVPVQLEWNGMNHRSQLYMDAMSNLVVTGK